MENETETTIMGGSFSDTPRARCIIAKVPELESQDPGPRINPLPLASANQSVQKGRHQQTPLKPELLRTSTTLPQPSSLKAPIDCSGQGT